MASKFKVGDLVRYRGTKEGRTDGDWLHYFGRAGIKKGSLGTIKHVEGYTGEEHRYFVHEDGRKNDNGVLLESDLDFATVNNWKAKIGDNNETQI